MRQTLGERLVFAACAEEMRIAGYIAVEGLEQRLACYLIGHHSRVIADAVALGADPGISLFDAVLWLLPIHPRIEANRHGLRLVWDEYRVH